MKKIKVKCFWCNKYFVSLTRHCKNSHSQLSPRSSGGKKQQEEMKTKETAFTSREVIEALVEYAQKYKRLAYGGLAIKGSNVMWRKNPDFSVILTTNIKEVENGTSTRRKTG